MVTTEDSVISKIIKVFAANEKIKLQHSVLNY